MKAFIYYGPMNTKIEKKSEPIIEEGEALLRVRSVGVCPTDIKVYKRGSKLVKPPVILGHEVSGEIVESKTPLFDRGDRVNVAADAPCLLCRNCLRGLENLCSRLLSLGFNVDGGYAEYMRIPRQFINDGLVFKLSDNLSYEAGALIEPVAVSLHALNLVNPGNFDTAVVIGDGPNGLIHVQLLKNYFKVKNIIVIGLLEHRLKKSMEFGANEAYNAKELKLNDYDKIKMNGIDLIDLTYSSKDTINEAKNLITDGTRLVIFGSSVEDLEIPASLNTIHYKQLILTGSSGTTRKDYKKAFEIVSNEIIDLKPLITNKYTLDEILLGFESVEKGIGIKTVIEP